MRRIQSCLEFGMFLGVEACSRLVDARPIKMCRCWCWCWGSGAVRISVRGAGVGDSYLRLYVSAYRLAAMFHRGVQGAIEVHTRDGARNHLRHEHDG